MKMKVKISVIVIKEVDSADILEEDEIESEELLLERLHDRIDDGSISVDEMLGELDPTSDYDLTVEEAE